MTGKPKSAVGRTGRSEADLGQKEAQLEKTQADLETASEAQLSHMEAAKRPRSLVSRRRKFGPNVRTPSAREICPGLFLWRWFALEGAGRSRCPVPVRIDMKKPRRWNCKRAT